MLLWSLVHKESACIVVPEMDNHDEPLSQIDAEIEKLRQQRPIDESDPECAEIDTSITGWLWAREKYENNTSGDRTLRSIGDRGQLLDVQAIRAKWEEHKMYRAVPDGPHMMLHLLARGAQHARSLDDANALLAKLVEILEFVWPTGSAQQHTAVRVERIMILVPKEAGVQLRQDVSS